MITDFQCNRVYLSSLLQKKSPKTYTSLLSALEKHGVEYRFLGNTNDIWCRDYSMAIIKRRAGNKLIKTIEEHFMTELVLLPWDESEFYGHADGLVRYIGNDRVLITNYDRFDKSFTCNVTEILQQHFHEVVKLKYNVQRQHKHNWAYINWLQTDKILLIPSFGYPEDEQAFEQITSLMPMYKGHAEMIDARDLIRHEGCLNCASWTIRQG